MTLTAYFKKNSHRFVIQYQFTYRKLPEFNEALHQLFFFFMRPHRFETHFFRVWREWYFINKIKSNAGIRKCKLKLEFIQVSICYFWCCFWHFHLINYEICIKEQRGGRWYRLVSLIKEIFEILVLKVTVFHFMLISSYLLG